MSIVQKIAKIDVFFGHRFQVVLGRVLEGVWEAKNLNFGRFFEEKSKAKTVDLLEGLKKPSSRGKKQSPAGLAAWARDQGDYFFGEAACRGGRGGTTKNQQLVILHALGPLARRIIDDRMIV